jgi:hypothetical protein
VGLEYSGKGDGWNWCDSSGWAVDLRRGCGCSADVGSG